MKLSFKQKIIGAILIMGILPMAITMVINLISTKNLVNQNVDASYRAQLNNIDLGAENYFHMVHSQTRTMAASRDVVGAMKAFSEAYQNFDPSTVSIDMAKYRERYTYQVEHTPGATTADVEAWMPTDPRAQALQYLYIASNPNPIGSKHEMDAAKDGSEYSQLHAKYQPIFRDFVREFGYYDMFLVAPDGTIVYTDFKEVDYMTNLKTGPYAGTTLGRVVQKAFEVASNETSHMTNFEPYSPSYNDSAAFTATAILDEDGKVIGAIAFQLPTNLINKLVESTKDIGKTADGYFVDGTGHLASKPRLNEQKVGELADKALVDVVVKHPEGFNLIDWLEADGQKQVGALQHITIPAEMTEGDTEFANDKQLNWYVVIEQAHKELMIPFEDSLITGLIVMACSILATILVGVFLSSRLVAPIVKMAKSFGVSAEQVAKANGQVSEAVSAMIAASEETSAQSTVIRKSSNEASGYVSSVSSAVDELNVSINDISQSIGETNLLIDDAVQKAQRTDEVVRNLGEAGKKISDVVRLINDLAEQTNLLALNAAIEAARAGDAGRGFAVVADEVKKLASHTSEATVEIGEQVQNIQSVSEQSVVALQAVVEAIHRIRDNATTVSAAVEEQSGVAKTIAGSVRDAADRVQEVDTNMGGIEQAATDTGVAADQVSGASNEVGTAFGGMKSNIESVLDEMGVKA